MKASLVYLLVVLFSLAAAEELYTLCYPTADTDSPELWKINTRAQTLERVQPLTSFEDIGTPTGIAVTAEGNLAVSAENDDEAIVIRLFPATESSSSSSSSSSSDSNAIPFESTEFEDYYFVTSGAYGLAAVPNGLVAAEDDNGDAVFIATEDGIPQYAQFGLDIEYSNGFAYNPADGRVYAWSDEINTDVVTFFGFDAEKGRQYPAELVDISSYDYPDTDPDSLEFSKDGKRAYIWTDNSLLVFDAKDDFSPITQIDIAVPAGYVDCETLSPVKFNGARSRKNSESRSGKNGKSRKGGKSSSSSSSSSSN